MTDIPKVLKVNFMEHNCENKKFHCFTNWEGKLFYIEKEKLLRPWIRTEKCVVCGEYYGR